MSAQRVLAAAAALREFTMEELATCCDEQPPAIESILNGAGDRVERIDAATAPSPRWRVMDLDGLRHDLARRAETTPPDSPWTSPGSGSVPRLKAVCCWLSRRSPSAPWRSPRMSGASWWRRRRTTCARSWPAW
ncbi:MAG TPA: hypothetical protein VHH34_04505 [Pseudonocardiaceae bacterium]|nr:hypothetical protein [Pseudonocardiaceae bacterium]